MSARQKVQIRITAKEEVSSVFREVRNGLLRISDRTKKARTSFQRLDQKVKGVSKSMKAAQGEFLAVAAAVYGAWRAFEKSESFEKQMHYVNTIARKNNQEFQAMSEQLREVSKEYGKTATDAAAALYDIYSNVGETGRNLDLLEESAKASVAGFVDMKTTGAAATGVMNAMGKTVSDVDEIFDAQFKTIERGKLTYQQLADSSGMFLASAKAAGQEYERVMGGFATLTKNIGNAAVSSTAMNSFLTRFSDPQFVSTMQKLGVQVVDSSGKFRDYVTVISELNEKLKTLDDFSKQKIIKKLVPGDEAKRALMVMLSSFETFFSDVEAVSNESAGAMKRNFDEMFDSSKIDVMHSKWNDFVLDLGEEIAPTAIKFIDSMDQGLEALRGTVQILKGSMQSLYGIILSIEAAYLKVRSLFPGGDDALDKAALKWQEAIDAFHDASAKIETGGVSVMKGLFTSKDERAGVAFIKEFQKHQTGLKKDRAEIAAGKGDGNKGGDSGNQGGGEYDISATTGKGRPTDLITAWTRWGAGLAASLGNAAEDYQARMDEAREALIRSRRGDNAADIYRAKSDYKMKHHELERRGATPMEFEAAKAERDMKIAEIRERARSDQETALNDKKENTRAREDVLLFPADRWQKEQAMLEREYEDEKALYEGDAEARAAIDKWYDQEKRRIEAERFEWEKAQAGYFADFTTGQLRQMLSAEQTTQNERYRIRAEINERIRTGEISQMETFRIGMEETVNAYKSKAEIMRSTANEISKSMKDGFQGTFFNAMKGDIDNLGDLWQSTMNRMRDAYLKAIAEMLAQKAMAILGLDGGSLFDGGESQPMDEGKSGGIGLGGIGSLVSYLFADGGLLQGTLFPIAAFASGGVVNRPTLAVVGEGRKRYEAMVPTDSGNIGVDLKVNETSKGNGNSGPNIYIGTYNEIKNVNATDAKSFREQMAMHPDLMGAAGKAAVMRDFKGAGPLSKMR